MGISVPAGHSADGAHGPHSRGRALDRLLAGLWFAAVSAAIVGILIALAYGSLAGASDVSAREVKRAAEAWTPPALLWTSMGSLAFGIAGAFRGGRLLHRQRHRPLGDSDAARTGAGIGIAASALLLLLRLTRSGPPSFSVSPADFGVHGGSIAEFALETLLAHIFWTLGPAVAIGAVGGWGLFRLRLAGRK